MDTKKLQLDILATVAEYVADTEAWDDAELCIDTTTGRVALIEADEAESLPDEVDTYEIMDFVEMTPDGRWIADPEAIASVVAEYK